MAASGSLLYDDLLANLAKIEVVIDTSERIMLECLPESSFHQLTRQTDRDHTGTRPYLGSIAMCHFIKRFGDELVGNASSRLTQVVELGAGVGLCGKYLARKFPACQVTTTDGEDLVLEIARRNAINLANLTVQKLRWSVVPGELQLDHNSFDLIVGTDLLYYRTDVKALMSTIDDRHSANQRWHSILARRDPMCSDSRRNDIRRPSP
jgi:2-polyprenyl-3-methyl-5-hydroxy-6-metoxy-1,4-benzoquinol methylase